MQCAPGLEHLLSTAPSTLSEEASALWVPQQRIARVPHTIDAFTFYREFVAASVPCIITGAQGDWGSRRWDGADIMMGAPDGMRMVA